MEGSLVVGTLAAGTPVEDTLVEGTLVEDKRPSLDTLFKFILLFAAKTTS